MSDQKKVNIHDPDTQRDATINASNNLTVSIEENNAALPAGTNNIGDVDVLSIAAGDNNIGNVDIASAIPAGSNNIGDVDVASIAAGDNNIGNVDVVSNVDCALEVAKGNISGTTYVHKFGTAPDFDTGDGLITIWDGADDSGLNEMKYNYSATADIDTISSSDNSDTQSIEIQGLDTNYDLVVQNKTLTGQTEATLDTALIRVFRIKNLGSTDNAGVIYCFTGGGSTSGVPDVSANVRAMIQIGNNQTLMAVYTIPNGKKGYMDSFYAQMQGASKSSPVNIELRVRPFGGVFQHKFEGDLTDSGGSHWQHRYKIPEQILGKSDIEIRAKVIDAGVTQQSVAGGFDLILVDD